MTMKRFLPFWSALFVALSWPNDAHSAACALLLEPSVVGVGRGQRKSSSSGLERRFRRLHPIQTALDEYDQFAIEFEQVLRAESSEANSVCVDDDIDDLDIDHHDDNKSIPETTELSEYYRRDHRDVSSQPITDPFALTQLLQDRYQARQAKNFKRVSIIDHQLRQEHGVRAYDHPPIWTRLKEPPAAHLRRQADKRAAEMKRLYGPNQHPYRQVGVVPIDPIFCSLTMRDIHTLLMRRTRSQLERRSEDADAIQLELLVHGIQVRDDLHQWTADPLVILEESPTELGLCKEPLRAVDYAPKLVPEPSDQAQMRIRQRIEQLVKSRTEALVRGETQLARFLLYELFKTYGVRMDDSSCTWSIAGIFDVGNGNAINDDTTILEEPPSLGKTLKEYSRPPSPFPPLLFSQDSVNLDSLAYRESMHSGLEDDRALDRVSELVQERIHKREEGKFLEADAIRNELWQTYVSTTPGPTC
jgi:hypothetical protein